MRPIYIFPLIASLIFSPIANACQSNPYSYQTITKDDWTEIRKMTKNTSMTINREYVSKYDINRITGFYGECSSYSNGRIEECIWIDGRDCKKRIKAKFRDNELSTIRKLGF